MSSPNNALVWLRRDLRLDDHRALEAAVHSGANVQHIFVFDTTILDKLSNKRDRRVEFIHESLLEMQRGLQAVGATLVVLHGDPAVLIPQFCRDHAIGAVYAARDFEPQAVARDQFVLNTLARQGVQWHAVDDHTVVAPDTIVQSKHRPYVVFTPYHKRWTTEMDNHLGDASVDLGVVPWMSIAGSVPSLASIGFFRRTRQHWVCVAAPARPNRFGRISKNVFFCMHRSATTQTSRARVT